jgi:CheY-like chemotaxis protein
MSKIMIVDDEPDILLLVERILQKEGHDVIKAVNGLEALEKLAEKKPDLILLDIMMPNIDGWETLRRIREQKGLKDVPVSMLTVKKLTPHIIEESIFGELVDYIQKPIAKEQLSSRVNKILKDLKDMESQRSRLSSAFKDKAHIVFEVAARKERLHESVLRNLREALKEAETKEEEETIKNTILSEEKALNLFRSWREEVEEKL